MDFEFEQPRDDLHDINLNTTVMNEHVTCLELKIRYLKEYMRAVWSTIHFTVTLGRDVAEPFYFSVLWLDAFPPSSGVPTMLIPYAILTGTTLDFNKHCKTEFRAYVETHEDQTPSNDMTPQSQASICLGITEKFKGATHVTVSRLAARQE